jgi:hypothetical protein
MRKVSITFAAATLVLTSLAFTAGAQTQQPGAASLSALVRNATPIHEASCGPRLFTACPWGTRRVCRWGRCWCAPC